MPNLLDLPLEIRLQIYEHVLDGLSLYILLKYWERGVWTEEFPCTPKYPEYLAHLGTSLRPESRVILGLPKTCRQIYQEFARHSRSTLPVVLSRDSGYAMECYYHCPYAKKDIPADIAINDPFSLIHPEHCKNLKHLTLTNRGYGHAKSYGPENLTGHYPDFEDLFNPTGPFMRVAEDLAAQLPSLRRLTLAPYVYIDPYGAFTYENGYDELKHAMEDFGNLARFLESEGTVPAFKRYVQKSIDTISAMDVCNLNKELVELDLDIFCCEFYARIKQRPTDNFPRLLDDDLWWTDQVDEQGFYLSIEREIRDTILVAKARKGPNGQKGIVDVRFSDAWLDCHSRPASDAKWMFTDIPFFKWRTCDGPRQTMEDQGFEIPAWLPEAQRKTLSIRYKPGEMYGGEEYNRELERIRTHSDAKVKFLRETGAPFQPDEPYTLFEVWAAGMQDRVRELPVSNAVERIDYPTERYL